MITRQSPLFLAIAIACGLLLPTECWGQKKGGGGTTSPPPPVTFRLQWLPSGTTINDINNEGDLIVNVDDGSIGVAQIWTAGNPSNLTEVVDDPDWTFNYATEVSNRAADGTFYVLASGFYQGARGHVRLKLSVPAAGGPPAVVDLATFPAGYYPTDVNIAGEVVGYCVEVPGGPRAAFFASDAFGLEIFDRTLFNVPVISDSGYVAYYYKGTGTSNEGFARWDSQTGELKRWYSWRWGIVEHVDNAGNFSGSRDILLKSGKSQRQGFFFDGASFQDFKAIERIVMNNNNDGVGNSSSSFTGVHLYLSSTRTLYDLSTLLAPSNSAADLAVWNNAYARYVTHINDLRVIAGRADSSRAFILFPVAAP